jgi:uncharacterized protein (DUF362 family)
MERRDFIKGGLGAGVLATASLATGFSGLAAEPSAAYDLVAVKNGEASQMFEKAIQSLGGMKNFVKKGQKVIVKPNIGWDVIPELAANTNPKLVATIVKHCLAAGASEVFVFDNTCDNWTKCYKNSGIEKAVKDAGGKMAPGNSEKYYQSVKIQGKKLKETKVHELILESDVFINVPILKHHSSGGLTIGMKNLMGIVWDRSYWHKNDLHQCIADFVTYSKPQLTVVDAYRVLQSNGPRGVSAEDVGLVKSLILSTDMVAADVAAAKIFGQEPEKIAYLRHAREMKLGETNLEKLNINRIKL